MFNDITIDTILSDPTLLIGLILLALGPVVFIYALIRFFTSQKSPDKDFVIPPEPEIKPAEQNEPQSHQEPVQTKPPQPAKETQPPEPASPPPEPTRPEPKSAPSENISDLKAQIEIAISQIKSLNKKIYDLEQSQELIEKHQAVRLEQHDLKEPPMNPSDFTHKLLKLAEHVILLEKEVSRLKSKQERRSATPDTPTSNPQKPPIMPL